MLLKRETVSGSGISWAVCKSAPRSSQQPATTPATTTLFFTGRMPFLPSSVKALKAPQDRNKATTATTNFFGVEVFLDAVFEMRKRRGVTASGRHREHALEQALVLLVQILILQTAPTTTRTRVTAR